MARDHQFLVRRNQPRRDSGSGHADPRPACSIRSYVEFDAEPARIVADLFSNVGRVLTDAAGEYDCIQPAKRGGKRTDLSPNAIAKEFNCELGPRIARGQKRTHARINSSAPFRGGSWLRLKRTIGPHPAEIRQGRFDLSAIGLEVFLPGLFLHQHLVDLQAFAVMRPRIFDIAG